MSTIIPTSSNLQFKYAFTFEAAHAGDLETLKRMHLHGYRCYDHTMQHAIEYGDLECVKWLHLVVGCPWSERTVYIATTKGHIECLRYALEQGCKWCYWTIIYAARYGRLECLKLLRQYGCDWKNICVFEAADNGHWDCVEYAINDGCLYNVRGLISGLDQNHNTFDFERHHTIVQTILPYVNSEYMNENTNTNCWMMCQTKLEEINLLKEYTMLVCHELPTQVVKYVICSFFDIG